MCEKITIFHLQSYLNYVNIAWYNNRDKTKLKNIFNKQKHSAQIIY